MLPSRPTNLLIWAACCVAAGLMLILYVAASTSAGEGVLMPLDDAYIHFQYAHQIAAGQFYRYNPGLPPTSGATSFLYPYLLALGDLLGFRGLNLGLWAMGIGALALACSAFIIARIGLERGAPAWIAGLLGAFFPLQGAFAWHAASGMETALITTFTLWAFWAVLRRAFGMSLIAGVLCALMRPEGAIVLILTMLFWLWERRSRWREPAAWLPLFLPLLAIGVQPLVNYLVTGSAVASGNAAKSLFGMIPADLSVIISRILANFTRAIGELFAIGGQPAYIGASVWAFSLVGLFALLEKRHTRAVGVFLIAIIIGGLALIATLDTAFWHFKRYQIPYYALLFAFVPIGAAWIGRRLRAGYWLAGAGLALNAAISLPFLPYYALNAGYVAAQPLAMARWLAANTPEDAVVAVHDVGMMRYMGGRTTLDIVGLTTSGAADYWRNGPGSVGEFIERLRPDYIASYGEGHGLGLGYLENTDLYANPLVIYTVDLDPQFNVALAAPTQGIYQPNYAAADCAVLPQALPQITPYLEGMELLTTVDVADIASEREAQYQWRSNGDIGGFPTEYRQFSTTGCTGDSCIVMDGGRRINGEEQFTVNATPGEDLILVTRLHPESAGRYLVFANGMQVAERVVPPLAGVWLEVPTLIPAVNVTAQTVIRIVPQGGGNSYQPYTHLVYAGQYSNAIAALEQFQAVWQDGAIRLAPVRYALGASASASRSLNVELTWQTEGSAVGDAVLFLHVLDTDGQIRAQYDRRPQNGALPPGNWLPSVLQETIIINVEALPLGDYSLVLGLYDPVTETNLPSPEADEFGRVPIGTITLQ